MLSLYELSVPVFQRSIRNTLAALTKAEEYAATRTFAADNFLQCRLTVDMYPLTNQIQIISDSAKGTVTRLAGLEPPFMEDNEKTIAALKERLHKTLHFLETLKAEQFEEAEERVIPFRYVAGKALKGRDYLVAYALPNFFFHVVTAYNILRNNGVPLGKQDYLGDLPLIDA